MNYFWLSAAWGEDGDERSSGLAWFSSAGAVRNWPAGRVVADARHRPVDMGAGGRSDTVLWFVFGGRDKERFWCLSRDWAGGLPRVGTPMTPCIGMYVRSKADVPLAPKSAAQKGKRYMDLLQKLPPCPPMHPPSRTIQPPTSSLQCSHQHSMPVPQTSSN